MRSPLGELAGERLSLPDYRADFGARQWEIGGQDSWKLERQQHFREPGFASWKAFTEGNWARSLRLVEDEREFLTEFSGKARDLGIGLYRVRVVEQPIIPYLQWELHLLRLRAECGELIRVVSPDQVRDYEPDGARLPELITLGSSTLYRVIYDDHGELDGAVKITSPRQVARATEFIRSLYAQGEDLAAFFQRAVAPLPPPRGEDVVRA